MQEPINEAKEDYYTDWYNDCRANLETDWFNTLPPEDHPLDDDMPDYLDNHTDEFYEFCQEQFNLHVEYEK